ncbi:F-box only protein 2 isoform X2 [Clupea harengus]|uniref:F-box only protein 2 isoform X2 n=1 Tax=Clupea harengus TaxID=7950 RepID=A0A6P8FKQ9_CLUHA|nr:F-box only protein 2 isoform X2 [Clupea harengus]
MAKNLLKNPCGEEQMDFWELTENGGSQWRVEDMPGDCGHSISDDDIKQYFATSFELCLKRQVVDLVAEGYTPEDLDTQPVVNVEDWYCGRTDCGCTYQLTACLLDENQEVNHSFSEYGEGLRFISFEHGGQDSRFWHGWFGVRVTGSGVRVEL